MKFFKKSPQLPGAGRTRAWHHHKSNTLTSPRAIYIIKPANDKDIMPSVQNREYELSSCL